MGDAEVSLDGLVDESCGDIICPDESLSADDNIYSDEDDDTLSIVGMLCDDITDMYESYDSSAHEHHYEWAADGNHQLRKRYRAKYRNATKVRTQKHTDKGRCTVAGCSRFVKKGRKCLKHRKVKKRKDEHFAKSSYLLPNAENNTLYRDSFRFDNEDEFDGSEKDTRETIGIKIVDIYGGALPQYYRVKKNSSLYKIFQSYSQRVGIPMHLLNFKCWQRRRGERFRSANSLADSHVDSPASLGMEEGAVIRVSKLKQKSLPTSTPKGLDEITIQIKDAVSLDIIGIYDIEKDDTGHPKWLFEEYASLVDTKIKFVRFKYKDRPLFLSSVKNKSASDLGMQDNDEIHAWHITERTLEAPPNVQRSEKKKQSNRKAHAKRGTKARGKNSASPKKLPYHDIDIEKKWKRLHSRAISRVFEEAATIFKEIRQKLDALNLERTKPKSKRINIKNNLAASTTKPIDNPPSEGLGGKAGKTHYAIHVGEVSNLYKSSKKRSKQRKHKTRRNITNENITIDLHGLTSVEAESKLNESLPVWVKIAMHGSYPFVTRVNIICGGGAQILSEVVENWIKQNEKVSNAPKKR